MAGKEPTRDLPTVLAGRARLPDHVVYRAFAHETVVLNLRTGKYHGINPTGGRMLEVLERTPSVSKAAAQLADEYDRPLEKIERDIYDFCIDLLQRDLIELNSAGEHDHAL